MRRAGAALALSALLLIAGCSTFQARRDLARDLVEQAGWTSSVITAGDFDLMAARKPGGTGKTLTVYLEGDGFAYAGPRRPSFDPTPADPLALRLALADDRAGPVAYLGRPCQYVTGPQRRNCSTAAWTARRYAPEIVASIGRALDALKRQTRTSKLILIGYSGGGALAVLEAARRDDVSALVTVAANLDLGYWTKRDGLTPLDGSLDPADFASGLGNIPQVHFAGDEDLAVGPDVTRAFIRRLPPGTPVHTVTVPGFTHDCCWARAWPSLLHSATF